MAMTMLGLFYTVFIMLVISMTVVCLLAYMYIIVQQSFANREIKTIKIAES